MYLLTVQFCVNRYPVSSLNQVSLARVETGTSVYTSMEISELFGRDKPVIGMLHLAPLPGTLGTGGLESVRTRLIVDAETLFTGGVDGFILENFGDAPFYPSKVPPHTVAFMAALAQEVLHRYPRPIGVNVLRNDAKAALAIASAVGAQFIRVNIYTGARFTDQGLIQGEAHEVLRYRQLLGRSVMVFADVEAKHSVPIGYRPLREEIEDTVQRGKADAIIVSGSATGRETEARDLKEAGEAACCTPVLVGSGVGLNNLEAMLAHADGVIVGTALKEDGVVSNAVGPKRAAQFMEAANRLRG